MSWWTWAPLHSSRLGDVSQLYPRRLQSQWCGSVPELMCQKRRALPFQALHFPGWYCSEAERLSFINGQKLNPPKWRSHCWRVTRDCDRDEVVGDWAEEAHTKSKNSLCHVTTCSFDIWIYGLNHKWPKASFIWSQDRNSTCSTELSFTFQVPGTRKTEQTLWNLGAFSNK